MHIKTEFKYTSYYHLILGLIIIFSGIYLVAFSGKMENLIGISPLLGIGGLVTYCGFKSRKASRRITIVLIIFHALQIVNFKLGAISYDFLFGPYIQLDIIKDWGLYFGFSNNFSIHYSSTLNGLGQEFIRISLINLILFIYLLDQIRFIPLKKDNPWESEV